MAMTMAKSVIVQGRVSPQLKADSEEVLQQIGLSMTDLIKMTLRQLVMQRGIPFEAKIPNAETIAAFEEDLSEQKIMSVNEFAAKYSR